MKRTLPKRSNLFLMEMIIAILFFALASAVCMQLFAKSKLLSMETSAKNHAMIIAKSAASSFETGDGSLVSLQADYPNSNLNGSLLTVYYDKNWNICSKKNARYDMEITSKEKNPNLMLAVITIHDFDSSELFELTASCYQPIKAGE